VKRIGLDVNLVSDTKFIFCGGYCALLCQIRVYKKDNLQNDIDKERAIPMNQPVHPDCCKSLFENAYDAIFIIDDLGRIHYANPASCQLLKKTADELIQSSFHDLFAREEVYQTALFFSLIKEVNSRSLMHFKASDGVEIDGEWTSSKFTDKSGAPRILLILRDVSNFIEAQRELKEAEIFATELATHDFLTGLLNRRGFEEFMEHELDRAKRSGKPTGLIMMDIDHFKQINDKFGHTGGDWLLREFATVMSTSIRDYDVFARFAGDEFILLLPETLQGESMMIAERLRLIIESHPIKYSGEHFKITASLGVISVPSSYDGPMEDLIALVDKALYLAKGNRNSVYFQTLDVEVGV